MCSFKVGETLHALEEVQTFLDDADDADGELPPVRVLLRWLMVHVLVFLPACKHGVPWLQMAIQQ